MSAPRRKHPRWIYVWDFVIHSFIGSFLFGIVFIPVVLLDKAVLWLATQETSNYVLYVINATKIVVLGIDSSLYIIFIADMAWRLVRKVFS